MKIEATMKYYLTPVRMVVIKGQKMTSVGEDVDKREALCTIGGNVKWYSYHGNIVDLSNHVPHIFFTHLSINGL